MLHTVVAYTYSQMQYYDNLKLNKENLANCLSLK